MYGMYSFIEDWTQNGNDYKVRREAEFLDSYATIDGSTTQIRNAYFTKNDQWSQAYTTGGVRNGGFYLITGGN